MNKKYVLLLLISLHGLCFVKAQNVNLKGSVIDTLKNPIEYANVIARPANQELNMSFSITDENGKYKLQLFKNETYYIEVRYFCLLYTSPSPRDATLSRMPSSA